MRFKSYRINKDMPKWFENLICEKLAPLLGMKRMSLNIQKIKNENRNLDCLNDYLESDSNITVSSIPSNDSDLIKKLIRIEKLISNIWDNINEKENEEEQEMKWKYMAIVMDRLFLIFSILYFVITFIPMIMTVGNLYRPN